MKIAVPTMGRNGLDDEVSPHFGRAPTFTIADTEKNEVKVIDNTSQHMGGQGYPPEIMRGEGVEVMLCSGLGPRAVTMFENFGIDVFVGAAGTVKDAIATWKEGKLPEATDANACREHRHH
ncbi:MAG: dinitrogenase iron-molybdenum cofactor biosynthesis protein [Candidatus Altiarchaeales archaeon WOR_SM1_86-2]|nr:MAG: dinitrogenase iron-molybdenum cofactor biosynthesis protein [Candidatus Altiarchaeales archaeon WOR_SM1_79]ODS39052.1 MAG: dinitrogenase iron-molybdenum cofactor biosynthesis protein [Candidatus Altiarchaeales archaeon WOR_SM1_86-2]